MSDFSGLPLVAGSIYGLRAWRQNSYGNLISPQQTNFEWARGENVSICYKKGRVEPPAEAPRAEVENIIKKHYLPEGAEIVGMFSDRQGDRRPASEWLLRVTFRVKTDVIRHPSIGYTQGYAPRAVEWTNNGYTASLSFYWKTIAQHMEGIEVPHDFENCACGFYAFTDTNSPRSGIRYVHQNLNMSDYAVGLRGGFSGIIEGYGTVTMGPYGFRAEKARIVAMYLPDMIKVTEMSAMFPDVLFFESEKKMLDEFPLGVKDLAA